MADFGGQPEWQVARTLQLFVRDVMPALRYTGRRLAMSMLLAGRVRRPGALHAVGAADGKWAHAQAPGVRHGRADRLLPTLLPRMEALAEHLSKFSIDALPAGKSRCCIWA